MIERGHSNAVQELGNFPRILRALWESSVRESNGFTGFPLSIVITGPCLGHRSNKSNKCGEFFEGLVNTHPITINLHLPVLLVKLHGAFDGRDGRVWLPVSSLALPSRQLRHWLDQRTTLIIIQLRVSPFLICTQVTTGLSSNRRHEIARSRTFGDELRPYVSLATFRVSGFVATQSGRAEMKSLKHIKI